MFPQVFKRFALGVKSALFIEHTCCHRVILRDRSHFLAFPVPNTYFNSRLDRVTLILQLVQLLAVRPDRNLFIVVVPCEMVVSAVVVRDKAFTVLLLVNLKLSPGSLMVPLLVIPVGPDKEIGVPGNRFSYCERCILCRDLVAGADFLPVRFFDIEVCGIPLASSGVPLHCIDDVFRISYRCRSHTRLSAHDSRNERNLASGRKLFIPVKFRRFVFLIKFQREGHRIDIDRPFCIRVGIPGLRIIQFR